MGQRLSGEALHIHPGAVGAHRPAAILEHAAIQKLLKIIGVLEEHPAIGGEPQPVEHTDDLLQPPIAGILGGKHVTQAGNHGVDARHTGQPSGQAAVDHRLDGVAEHHLGAYLAQQAAQGQQVLQIVQRIDAGTPHLHRVDGDAQLLHFRQIVCGGHHRGHFQSGGAHIANQVAPVGDQGAGVAGDDQYIQEELQASSVFKSCRLSGSLSGFQIKILEPAYIALYVIASINDLLIGVLPFIAISMLKQLVCPCICRLFKGHELEVVGDFHFFSNRIRHQALDT